MIAIRDIHPFSEDLWRACIYFTQLRDDLLEEIDDKYKLLSRGKIPEGVQSP